MRWIADNDDYKRDIGVILVPGSNPYLDTIVFANFQVSTILAISTYKTQYMISEWWHNLPL